MTPACAIAFCLLLLGLAVFQALLAAGRPLGRFAWGGQHDVLPTRLRVSSVVAIGIYVVMAIVVLEAADLIDLIAGGWPVVAVWILTGYLVFNTFLNAISRSRDERLVMTPPTVVLSLLALAVALD